MLIIPNKTIQPITNSRIGFSAPKFLWTPSIDTSGVLSKGATFTHSATTSNNYLVRTPLGVARRYIRSGYTSYETLVNTKQPFSTGLYYTHFVYAIFRSFTNSAFLEFHNSNSYFKINSDGSIFFSLSAGGSSSTNTTVLDIPSKLWVTGSDATGYNMIVNGVTSTARDPGYGHIVDILRIGGSDGDGTANVDILIVAAWDRKLSTAEISLIDSNPWMLFGTNSRILPNIPLELVAGYPVFKSQTGGVFREPVFGARTRYLPRRITVILGGVQVSVWRPSTDITDANWTGSPDNTNLYNNIDEETYSDTDYIQSPDITVNTDPYVFGLTTNTPSAGIYNIKLRARRTDSTGELRVLLQDSGGSTVGTSSWQALTNSFAEYTLQVSTTGAAARGRIEIRNQ